MSQLTNSQFSDSLPQVDNYQPFPTFSLVIFAISLIASILAMVNPKLLSLPMITAFLSIFALIVLHLRVVVPQALMFVSAALAISLFSFALRATYQTLHYQHMESTAISHAELWLGLIKESRLPEAMQMMLPRAERLDPGADLSKAYGTLESPMGNLKTYADLEPEKTIRELGEDAKFTVDFVEYDQPHNRHDVFRVNFRLHRTESDDDDYLFSLAMLRIRPLEGNIFWEFKQLKPMRPMFPRNRRGIGVYGGTQDNEVVK